MRATKGAPAAIELQAALEAIKQAMVNWDDWKEVYTHPGPVAENPLLVRRVHFGCFLWEYGVARTVGYHEDDTKSSEPKIYVPSVERARRLQERLRTDGEFLRALETGDSTMLLDAGRRIALKHAAMRSVGGIFSLVSKVAALCRPMHFMASDTFARRGLALLTKDTTSSFEPAAGDQGLRRFNAYQSAARRLADNTDKRWPSDVWQQIAEQASDFKVPTRAFALRVVDNLAMATGGMKSS